MKNSGYTVILNKSNEDDSNRNNIQTKILCSLKLFIMIYTWIYMSMHIINNINTCFPVLDAPVPKSCTILGWVWSLLRKTSCRVSKSKEYNAYCPHTRRDCCTPYCNALCWIYMCYIHVCRQVTSLVDSYARYEPTLTTLYFPLTSSLYPFLSSADLKYLTATSCCLHRACFTFPKFPDSQNCSNVWN